MPNETTEEIIEKSAKPSESDVKKKVDLMMIITIGVVIVLLTTLGGLIQSSLAIRSATYQDLVDKVNEQNFRIQILSQEIQQLQQSLSNFGTTTK